MKNYAVIAIMTVFIFMSACKKTDSPANSNNTSIKAVWTFRGLTDSTLAGTLAASSFNGDSFVTYTLTGAIQRVDLMIYHARPLTAGAYNIEYDYPPQAPNYAGIVVYTSPPDTNWYNPPQPGFYGNQYSQPVNVTVNGNITTLTGTGIVLQNYSVLSDSTKINFVITQVGQ